MAGQFELLYAQDFSSVSSVTVTHNLDRLQVGVIARIGNTSRNDLIYSIVPSISDPRNEVVVTFVGTQSGEILISDTDYVFANIPTPENSAQVSQLTSSAYSPGGADTQVQFNDGGSSFSGSSNFVWLKASNILSVTGVISGSGNISGSAFYGDGGNLTNLPSAAITTYNTSGNDRIVTSVNATTVQGEANLTFDGTTLAVTGDISGSGNVSGSAFYGDGSNLAGIDLLVGNVVYVDAVNGNDTTGVSGNHDLPFLTITAALAASAAGDTVYVFPGTYDETSITIPANVTLHGLDRLQCIISHSVLNTTTMITMGTDSCVENLTIEAGSSGTRNLVDFPLTTSMTSILRNAVLRGTAGNVNGISVFGTGTSTNNWVTVDHVDVKGAGIANGLVSSKPSGFFIVRDSILHGLVGMSTTTGGNVELQDCKITGITGLNIGAGTTVFVNQGTRWGSIANAGTLAAAGLYFNPPPILTYSTSSNNNIITAVDSTTVQGEANLTFDGTTLAITGDISGSGNISGSAFYGDGSSLAALNATNISAGTLDNARLPATISVTNVTASTLVSASAFYGDGSNLTGIAAGSDTQVQFRDAGVLAADVDFTWNKLTNILTLGGMSGSGNISGRGTSLARLSTVMVQI